MTNALVRYPFTAVNDDEISLDFNDIVEILHDLPDVDGWCVINFRSKQGKCPLNILDIFEHNIIGIKGITLSDFTYKTENNSNHFISFKQNEVVIVVSRSADGWNKGIYNSHLGLYPEGFVELEDTPPFTDFENIITSEINGELPFINSLFKVVNKLDNSSVLADDLTGPLIQLLRHRGNFFEFMEAIVRVEVAECPEESVLFRKNSWASKLFSRYARNVCEDYLKLTVAPLIESIIQSNCCFEVNPTKLEMESDVNENQENLLKASLYFLESLLESISKISDGLRYCFRIVQQQVIKKYPSACEKAIGGFYFLRIICPIVAGGDMSAVGLNIAEISSTARRGLVLITKILQNLANNVQFGAKEGFMVPLNEKMNIHREICKEILEKLPLPLDSPPIEQVEPLHELEVKQIVKRLHSWMCKDALMVHLYKKMKQGSLPEDKIIQFKETALKCGSPLPDSALFYSSSGKNNNQKAKILQNMESTKKSSKTSVFKTLTKREKKDKRKIEEKYYEIPTGKIQCGSYLKGKQISSGQKSAKLKYYAIYSNSTKIYAFPSFDDAPRNVCGIIDLAPTFSVKPMQKGKQNVWEFKLRTIKEEYTFTTTEENIFRKWIHSLDKRLNESVMSEEDKNEKQALIISLEEKLSKYKKDLQETKDRLKLSYDNPSEEDSKHLEELMIAIANLKQTIQTVNE